MSDEAGSHEQVALCRCCDICHAEEEVNDMLVACEFWDAQNSCVRCPSKLRAHADCLEKWHQALARSSSFSKDCSTTMSAPSTAPRVRSRSASSITESVARRVRCAIANPRLSRRSAGMSTADGEKVQRSRSATASPSGACSPVAVGTTASCGDLRRLEEVFEPRLAPYTPPLRLRSGLSSSNESFNGPSRGGSLSEGEIEALERMIFEPRDATCTPPLRRRPLSAGGIELGGGGERHDETDSKFTTFTFYSFHD